MKPRLSDHALVRLLERGGFDVAGVRDAVEQALANAHAAALSIGGGNHVIVVDKMAFVVREGVVTTVVPAGAPWDHAGLLDARNRA